MSRKPLPSDLELIDVFMQHICDCTHDIHQTINMRMSNQTRSEMVCQYYDPLFKRDLDEFMGLLKANEGFFYKVPSDGSLPEFEVQDTTHSISTYLTMIMEHTVYPLHARIESYYSLPMHVRGILNPLAFSSDVPDEVQTRLRSTLDTLLKKYNCPLE